MTNKDLEIYSNAWLNTVTHEDLMANTFPVIVDRDDADVERVKQLNAKGWGGMTPEERKEWNGIMKGAYNDTDMNRVGMAVEYLTNLFQSYGYDVTTDPKTDWKVSDIPLLSQWRTYLTNVRTLRGVVPLMPDTPGVPGNSVKLRTLYANNIEKILMDIDAVLEKLTAAYRSSNAAVSGGDMMLIR